ncbi:MAG: hypothetical protein ACT4OY_06325 [Alphaproteobacteria bacterium]
MGRPKNSNIIEEFNHTVHKILGHNWGGTVIASKAEATAIVNDALAQDFRQNAALEKPQDLATVIRNGCNAALKAVLG